MVLLAAWQLQILHRLDMIPKRIAESLTGRCAHLHHTFVMPDDIDHRNTGANEGSPMFRSVQPVPMPGKQSGAREPQEPIRLCTMQHELRPRPGMDHSDRQGLHPSAQCARLLLLCIPPEELSSAIANSKLFPRIYVALDVVHIRIDQLPHQAAKHMPEYAQGKHAASQLL